MLENTVNHKFVTPSKNNIAIHSKAIQAHTVWLKFNPKTSYINLSNVNRYVKPLIRMIRVNADSYLYFDNFIRMSDILEFEAFIEQPFLLINNNDHEIIKMAWSEVLKISFYRDVNHPQLWRHLKDDCPPTILKELMVVDNLNVADYCQFCGISKDHYDYQNSRLVNNSKELGLPQNKSWLDE
ncbi:hypothetical protein [Psychrobacter sp.]|uniref:hypothetical protein n=1 Tax=Psychrobacter sp. TaxID=56811 RepID=UPI0025F2406E|nr:hypothetical protein [Psychrobacter sp.]